MEKIILGSDHAGFKLKEDIKSMLKEKGFEVEDLGTNSEESVDYPDYAKKVAKKTASEKAKGILVCGTGLGMSMAANKVQGIRAALCHDKFTAEMSRKHNDANILCLGARTKYIDPVKDVVDTWLSTDFEGKNPGGERHQRRVDKIEG